MTCRKHQSQIAIIGAGLSGLTMAHRLIQKGYNVCIYEARSRVGGRVQTVKLKNNNGNFVLAELGGHNITDGGSSPHFLNLCTEMGLNIVNHHRLYLRGFYDEGIVHNARDLLRANPFLYQRFKDALNMMSAENHSMADIINYVFNDTLQLKRLITYYLSAYEGLHPHDLAITCHNIETLDYFLRGGLAAAHGITDKDETFLTQYVENGNSQLPLVLAQCMQKNLLLNKALQGVSRHDDQIKLLFNDHTHALCDTLILSIPCGVFSDISIDHALISKERLNDFSHVQYGKNAKIIMPSPEPFDKHKHSYTSINNEHYGTFYSDDYTLFTLYTDGIVGKNIQHSINKIFKNMVDMIEKNHGNFTKKPKIPISANDDLYAEHDNPILKSWAEDMYSKGSYSAIGTQLNQKFLDQTHYQSIRVKTLFRPINDHIFFIGEHTSIIDEIGTMEAAIESAERLATLF